MSLQVWLPLNGDLHNQGLANITATNNGATVDNNGKIGKCYRFGTAKSFLELPTEAMNDFTTECTVSFWLKILTRNTGWDTYFQAGLGGTAWNNYVFGFLRNNSNKCCFTVSGEAGTSSDSFVTSDMELDTWYHITLVYQTGHCLIYMDGMLYHDYSTAIVPAFNNITTITIGCANTKTNYQSNCLLNDLRIYDHALSPLEVKHLAQGLVLHYPLNRGGFGGENIISGTSPNEIQYTYPSSGCSDKFQSITTIVPTASQYTLSFWAKSTVVGDKLRTHFYYPNTTTTCVSSQGITKTASDGGMDFTLSTEWTRYWVTYTQNETTAVKRIICPRMGSVKDQPVFSGTGTVSIKCIKLEEGSIPTPWIPSPKDNLYSAMALDENIIHDTSGFQNNGELVVIGENLIDKNNVTSGGYINSAGGITNTSGWNYTNYIKVNPSTSYIASSISSGGSGTYYALYDASKTLTRTVLITASQNPTFTTTAAERYVRFSIRSLSNELDTAKLEEGTTVTGYESEGSIEWETNSPRYTLACNPHSVNSTQNARLGTAYIRGDCALTTPSQLTIAFWCYARNSGYGYSGNTGQGAFCTTTKVGDSIGTDYMASAMNHYDSGVIVNSSDGNTHPKLSIVLKSDEWHHYAFTFDGKNAIAYKDGILVDTKSFSSSVTLGSFSSIIIGLSRAGGVWRRNDNTYSDFRVYATALSADDVMALYKNAGYVDSDGNVYSYEITE